MANWLRGSAQGGHMADRLMDKVTRSTAEQPHQGQGRLVFKKGHDPR